MSGQDTDQARDALDRALAARPRVDGEALTEAAKALCRERDALRRGVGAEDAARRRRLKGVNVLITLLHAGHYPLGATPWDLLEQARRGLDDLAPSDV